MAPSSYNPMDGLGRPGGPGAMISAPASGVREIPNALGDFLPESRKRKIEEVDSQQPDAPIRLGLQFNHEGGGGSSSISPTSYRTYADFPRTSYPSQMPAPATAGQLCQKGSLDEENPSTIVRTALEERQVEHTMDDHPSLFLVDRAEVRNSRSYAHRLSRDRIRKRRHGLDQPQFIGE